MNEAKTKVGRPAFRKNPARLSLSVSQETKRTLMRHAKAKRTSVSAILDGVAAKLKEEVPAV